MFRRTYRALQALFEPASSGAGHEPPEVMLEALRGQVHRETERLSDQLNLVLQKLDAMALKQSEVQRELQLLMAKDLPPRAHWNQPFTVPVGFTPPHHAFARTTVCRQADLASPLYPYWMRRIGFAPLWHRKRWEFMYICQALHERGMLKPGMRGLGFGVGEEPLAACFAAAGATLTCTDMPPEAAAHSGWIQSAQHAQSREALRRSYLCADAVFDAGVDFRFCDMNHIDADLTGFDFCWSSCAFEHLGSIEHGLAFVERSVECLKPGGFAVHTTEFNLSSNDDTLTSGATVLFRRRDLEALAGRLAAKGHIMTPLDLDPGEGELDRYLDVPPYRDEPHLKLALEGYAITSVGLVVQRGPA
jgi:hypothetical protein